MNSELRQKLLLASVVQQKQILETHIQEQLAGFLNFSLPTDIKPQQSLLELVNDSLKAVDFKILLENSLGCKLRSTLLFDYPSLDVLVDYLADKVSDSEEAQHEHNEGDDKEADLIKEQLASLSADDIAQMLAEELNTLSVEQD